MYRLMIRSFVLSWTRPYVNYVLGVLLWSAPIAGLPADEEFRLVTGNDYKPFTDESLPEGGLANEIVARIYDQIGERYSIDWKPWKRGFQEGVSGVYRATYPYVFTEERNELYAFSDPIYTNRLKLFMRKDSGLNPKSIQNAKGKRICWPLGWAAGAELAALFSSGAIGRDEPNDMETCFKLLGKARTDFVLANQFQGWESARAIGMNLSEISASSFDVETNPLYVIFSRTFPDFEAQVKRFNEGLAKLRASGDYDVIVTKHLGDFGPSAKR